MSVIEDSKDQKELIATQLAQAAQIQLSTDNQQHLQQQTLTVQQLQQLQALDNVGSIESHPNQNSEANDPLTDNLHIVKDEKVVVFFCLCVRFSLANALFSGFAELHPVAWRSIRSTRHQG